MTVTLKQPVMICLAAVSFSCAVASGQQPQSGNATAQSRPTTLPAQSPLIPDRPLAPDRLFALASSAVVKLTIKDEDDRQIGIASGFIVRFEKNNFDIQGQALYRSTVITNYHVIRPAINIDVSFSDGHTGWVSQVTHEDERADLAVLSVFSLVEPDRTLPLRSGPSRPIGTKVYAIGSPQGLSNTLSEGLISGYRQRGRHKPWIQITAPISPGSSGGPLFSPEGSVLGVTTAFLKESQNVNFAVPVSEVCRLLNLSAKPRQIWKGASIRETARHAFRGAALCFSFQFLQPNSDQRADGQSEQAFERFRQEQLSAGVSAGDQLALLLKGHQLYLNKQYSEAIGMLRRATKADPGEYAYLAYYALAEAIEGYMWTPEGGSTKFKAPIAPLIRAKELNPDFGPTFYSLCRVYQLPNTQPETNMYPEILLAADSLVRLMPRCYEGYRFRGEVWAELGREQAFERDFETAAALRPNDRDLLIAKGLCYMSLGQLQKAVDQYRDAIKLDGNYVLGHLNLAMTLQRMGKYDEAIKSYQRAERTAEGSVVQLHNDIERSIAECRRQMMKSP